MQPPTSSRSDPRCPRCHKKLFADVGAHETRGDLEVVWSCLNGCYSEQSLAFAEQARKVSPIVQQIAAENLRQKRLRGFGRDTGVEIPLVYSGPIVMPEDAEVADG